MASVFSLMEETQSSIRASRVMGVRGVTALACVEHELCICCSHVCGGQVKVSFLARLGVQTPPSPRLGDAQ